MNRRHNLVQLSVYLLGGPVILHRVLAHLQARGCYATCVDSLTGAVGKFCADEGLDSLGGTTHIRHLSHNLHAICHQLLSVFAVKLVLGSARHSDIHLNLPRFATGGKGRAGELLCIGSNHVVVRCAELEHISNFLFVKTGGVVDITVRTRDGYHLCTKLCCLACCAPSHVAEARDCDGLTLDIHTLLSQHLAEEIYCTIACCLGANQRATKGHTLTGEDTCILQSEFAIHAIEVANLAATNTDITCGHVGLGTNVTPQLGHKGLAETHNLCIGFTLGVEVRTTLCTTHRECGEGILEALLEAEELQDAGVYAGMETQTALIGADCVIELEAVACIHLHLTLVINPHYLEGKTTVGLYDTLCDACCLELGVLVIDLLYGHENLAYRLQILTLAGVLALQLGHQFLYVHCLLVFIVVLR